MKNMNRENGFKWISLLVACLVVVSTGFVTGCGEDSGKKKGKSNTRWGEGGRVDPGTSGYTNLLTTARSKASSSNGTVDMGIEIFTANDQTATQNYYGPVNVYGYLDYQGSEIIVCGFSPGIWDLRTTAPNGLYGTDQTGIPMNLMGIQLEARNRSNGRIARINIVGDQLLGYGGSDAMSYTSAPGIEVEDGVSTVGIDGYTYDNVFWGEISVESVDGIPCYFNAGFYGSDWLRFYFSQSQI